MKKKNNIFLLILLIGTILAFGCNKNYYSGNGKGSGCGCPTNH